MRLILCSFGLFALVLGKPTTDLIDSELLKSINEDAYLKLPELAQKYGYPTETHTVPTDDGYLLTVHRIPYGRNCGPDKPRKSPVLVQHGLLCSSIDWLVMGPEKGLGYILADDCFDVWLGNSRGNTESRAHVSLDPSKAKFWKFSWHEMGIYDLPAVIDYILNVTQQPALHYVGHSQGTTQFFIFASEKPEYHQKIKSMHALAPVAFMNHLESPFVKALSYLNGPLEDITSLIGLNEFLPTTKFLSNLGGNLCVDEHPTLQAICADVLFLLCGFDSVELNATMLPVIVGHTPAGASTRQLLHYAQEIVSGKFRQYDYGLLGNLKHYNSVHPPEYDLTKANVPIALHYSRNDWMAAEKDVERLAEKLPNVIGRFLVKFDQFNHLDYMWAIHVRPYLYDRVLNLMNRFEI